MTRGVRVPLGRSEYVALASPLADGLNGSSLGKIMLAEARVEARAHLLLLTSSQNNNHSAQPLQMAWSCTKWMCNANVIRWPAQV